MQKPIAYDFFCGLGGWTQGLLAEGYHAIGYDIEAHEYGDEKYPGELRLADVLTLDGAQFKDAALFVASPPCQEFSYMAMPWTRAKQIGRALRGQGDFPEGYTGSRTLAELTALFEASFRIQREASAAAGRHIPMVVENVRGAIPWVGRSAWNYGSYHLWGDVPALMPQTLKLQVGDGLKRTGRTMCYPEGSANPDAVRGRTGKLHWQDDAADGRKNPGFRFDGSGRSFQSESVARHLEGVKGSDCYERDHPAAFGWKKPGTSSHSKARKAAAARIAKIPLPLSSWIARTYKPQARAAA